MIADPTLIPFNPVVPFHGDVKRARFPYLQVERNDEVDVEKIPRLASSSAD